MTANLSVECNEDEVKLYLSSSGILVRNVKVFEECVWHSEPEVSRKLQHISLCVCHMHLVIHVYFRWQILTLL